MYSSASRYFSCGAFRSSRSRCITCPPSSVAPPARSKGERDQVRRNTSWVRLLCAGALALLRKRSVGCQAACEEPFAEQAFELACLLLRTPVDHPFIVIGAGAFRAVEEPLGPFGECGVVFEQSRLEQELGQDCFDRRQGLWGSKGDLHLPVFAIECDLSLLWTIREGKRGQFDSCSDVPLLDVVA